jgi:hypothetical protein
MKHTILTEDDINEIIHLYTSKEVSSTHKIASQFHVSHQKITKLLKDNGVLINNKGGQLKYGRELVVHRYLKKHRKDNTSFIAVCKNTGKQFNDYNNTSGALSHHIKKIYPDLKIPTSYKRRMIFKSTGRYWHEEFFNIVDIINSPTRKCKYCSWETVDINNKTGAYVNHLKEIHNKNINDYIVEFPDEIIYHNTFKKTQDRLISMKDDNDYLICQICGEKLKSISNNHLQKHNITPNDYKLKYGIKSLMSNTLTKINGKRLSQYNEEGMTFNPSSKDEKEIKDILTSSGLIIKEHDRSILNGKEIDIVIPDLGIGIEYHGNKFHTEDYGGKYPNYHLDKLTIANKKGFGLIQIFEDEWILHKDLIINKLKHIIGISEGQRIGARKCIVKEILTHEKNEFLKTYHIQGSDTSTIKVGSYYDNILVAVMTFRNISPIEFELTRFATNYNFIIPGLASKMINYFIKKYSPKRIISFADRRWTIKKDDNLYTKLKFKLIDVTKPDYRYYNTKISRYTRFHKFGFRKKNLSKKYDLDMNLTEREMTKLLGYDRIWDCGLFKYELIVE